MFLAENCLQKSKYILNKSHLTRLLCSPLSLTLNNKPWRIVFELAGVGMYFTLKPSESADQLIIILKLKPIMYFPMKNATAMNSDCNDSPSNLVMFLFLLGTCSQQQKHVCALSSGRPLLKWDRPHIPLSTEKGFDHCCQAESTRECVLQGVGEVCVQAESACDVFIRPMQIEALPHSSNE